MFNYYKTIKFFLRIDLFIFKFLLNEGIFNFDYLTLSMNDIEVEVTDLEIEEYYEKIKDNSVIITNVATGNFHLVLDVINKAEMSTNKKIHYIIDERREGDPDKLYASSNNILNHQNQYFHLHHNQLEQLSCQPSQSLQG